jgi:hypothetical protein
MARDKRETEFVEKFFKQNEDLGAGATSDKSNKIHLVNGI